MAMNKSAICYPWMVRYGGRKQKTVYDSFTQAYLNCSISLYIMNLYVSNPTTVHPNTGITKIYAINMRIVAYQTGDGTSQ